MPLLSTSEALHVSDSFLSSLYGDVIFRRWKELKDEMKFSTEREYVSWLIDVANHYKSEHESQQLSQETDTNQFATSNVKSEEGLNHYNEGQGQSYETPVSEYSHLSSTQDARNSKNYSEQFTLDTKVEGAGNSNEQTSVTSQVDNYNYEQSYYDDVRDDETMLEMERNEEISLSSDDEDEGDEGTMYDGNGSLPTRNLSLFDTNYTDTGGASPGLPSSAGRYNCPHCTYSSNYNMNNVRKHILAVHEKQKPFSCQYCNYKCSERSTLKNHLINKHGYKSKYCCKRCIKYFPKPHMLHKHYASCGQRDSS